MLERVVDQVVEAGEEIEHPHVDAGGGVDAPEGFGADVQVGEVEEADGIHGRIVLCGGERGKVAALRKQAV